MGSVISLRDHVEICPILRKGDLVRLTDMQSYTRDMSMDEVSDLRLGELLESEGLAGIVTLIEMILPPSHEEAPGQVTYVTVAVPLDDGYIEIPAISTQNIRRIIGPEAHALRGY